jgi:hypothetical protein
MCPEEPPCSMARRLRHPAPPGPCTPGKQGANTASVSLKRVPDQIHAKLGTFSRAKHFERQGAFSQSLPRILQGQARALDPATHAEQGGSEVRWGAEGAVDIRDLRK